MAETADDDPRAALVALVRETAARLGTDRLTIGRFCKEAGIGMKRVWRDGGPWPELCTAAGLTPTVLKARVPDEDVFAALRDCCLDAGAIVTRVGFERASPWSDNLVSRRWGTWRTALAAFRDWLRETEPGFPLMDALDAALVPRAARRRRVAQPGARAAAKAARPPWPARDGAHPSGPPLGGFRAMLHAPANELGVVVLFGMVAADLGYAIDAVASGFPDCEARRIIRPPAGVSKGPNGEARWQAVRVEFEYRSRAFRDHRHDPAGCDVVVCWEHDWPDCPLEVLELRSAIAGLAS